MHAELRLHGKPISSMFELLGDRENDVTYSLGWTLSQCPEFRRRIVAMVLPESRELTTDRVLMQERGTGGITDIELAGPRVRLIIEAKRHLDLPTPDQLGRYAKRLALTPEPEKALVTMSLASAAYASVHLPPSVQGIPCRHLSLAQVDTLARVRAGSHAEKRLLTELSKYLNRIARMQDLSSNMVYVVVLSDGRPPDCDCTWREMVELHGKYCHPIGGGYPREPVNYVGFRFGGQLRSIRHVASVEVVADLTGRVPGCRLKLEGPHYLYTLGPAIVPSKTVRNGNIVMANRVYAAVDLLLTSDTISEAGALTRKRLSCD